MKNVILGSFLAVAVVGCTATESGHIQANWTFSDINTSGQETPTGCPVGYDTVELHTVAASPDGTAIDTCTSPSSDCYIDLFNCTDMTGISAPLPAQNYLTWLVVTDSTTGSVYATSTEAFVDITAQDLSYNADILNNGGYFRMSWSLMGESSGQPLTCAETDAASAAGGSVEAVSTISGTSIAFTDKFNCEDHFGYSSGLPSGSYTIAVDALNAQNQALGSQSTVRSAVIGSTPNDINDLGHLVLGIMGQ